MRTSLEEYCKLNDLEYLLNEWDCEKNGEMTPDTVGSASDRFAWWVCENGHSYDMQIKVRTRQKCNCPVCSGRRVISGENDLATLRPDLLVIWDYEKNTISPSEVRPASNDRAWWRCEIGHSWDAKINNISVRGNRCPFCSGHRTLFGYNDLYTWCKENSRDDLIEEWDDDNQISMKEVSHANNMKVWWHCSLGHKWEATIGSRTTGKPAGCPFCSNPPKRILVGFNDLKTWCMNNKMEHILEEWNYEKNEVKPDEITFASGQRIWWQCRKNHEWCVSVNSRTTGAKTNCPICARNQTSFPEQAIAFYLKDIINVYQRYMIGGYEVDIYLPDNQVAVEYDGLFYHNSQNSVEKEEKKNIALEKKGITLFRVKESDGIKQVQGNIVYYPLYNGKYITEDFEWALNSLFSNISDCIGEKLNIDVNLARDEYDIRAHYMSELENNSVAALFPELIEEWDVEKNKGLGPETFSARNNKKVWWKCKNGHSWLASIHSRTVARNGCPYCAGQIAIPGVDDLEVWCKENNSDLLCEWDYNKNEKQPCEYKKTSNETVFWICEKGHGWRASIANRIHGTGCPICNTGNNVPRGKVTLQSWCEENNYDHLLKEWNKEKNGETTPADYSYRSQQKVWWRCDKGHEWEAQIKSRTYNHGCPFCSSTYKKALKGVNDLATWCSENDKEYIIKEWNTDRNGELSPTDFTKGSHKRVWWKCVNGHEWEAVIKDRTKENGNTCPYCKNE